MTYGGTDRELIEGIRDELNRYPITYEFGRSSKHNYVQIKTATGGGPRIVFASNPRSTLAFVKARGVIRRELRKLNGAAANSATRLPSARRLQRRCRSTRPQTACGSKASKRPSRIFWGASSRSKMQRPGRATDQQQLDPGFVPGQQWGIKCKQ